MYKNTYFIGIDSGGTKSELCISDADERIIHKSIYKSLHYSIHGKEKVAGHLRDIIHKSIKKLKLDLRNCKGICVGLTGVREKQDKTALQKELIKLLGIKNIIVESDTIIAHHGAFGGEEGLMLICGTGSVLYGISGKEQIRLGGWGWKIGDYGSGYEIGKHAIKHLANTYNKGKKPIGLSKAIEKRFSLNRNNLLFNIYQNNFEFQKLVPLVLEHAGKKDKDAKRIIEKSVEELMMHFELYFLSAKNKKEINVSFSGSIIEQKNPLSDLLRKSIKRKYPNIKLTEKIHSPSKGAIILAKNKFDKN